jgi:hypothetical protein
MIRRMVKVRMEIYAECVLVPRETPVIRWTGSLIPWYLGVSRTLVTGTITGLGCMGDWRWMDSLAQQ